MQYAENRECYYCRATSSVMPYERKDPSQWQCKNLLCHGPGAAWFRSKLTSFVMDEDHLSYYLDPKEWHKKAFEYVENNPKSHYVAIVNID